MNDTFLICIHRKYFQMYYIKTYTYWIFCILVHLKQNNMTKKGINLLQTKLIKQSVNSEHAVSV